MSNILLVEDDQIISSAYARKLRNEGHQVSTAADGVNALQQVASARPDLIIIDLMLPLLNGVEVIRRIRANAETSRLPIVVFSNAYLSNLVQEAWKAGANHCLTKATCSPAQLLETVRKALGQSVSTPRPSAPSPQPLESETAECARLQKEFLASAPSGIAQLRSALQGLTGTVDRAERISRLGALYSLVHGLTSGAAVSKLYSVSRLASALEAFLKELSDKPEDITLSSLRTIASAIDRLGHLLRSPEVPDGRESVKSHVLVVDEDEISRRAITYALDKAQLKYTSIPDADDALVLLRERRFDLILLDAGLPGTPASEIGRQISVAARQAGTPMIIVAGFSAAESRPESPREVGFNTIAKPFQFMELAVRALVLIQTPEAPRNLNTPAA